MATDLSCAAPQPAAGSAAGSARLSRFAADRKASAAIEFAFIAAPFFMFVLAVLQIGIYYFGLQSLDHATRLAAREIMLGQVPASAQSLGGFKSALVCPNFLLGFACDDVAVSVHKVAADGGEGPSDGLARFVDRAAMRLKANAGAFCIGGPGDYVFVDVSYRFPNFVSSIMTALGLASEPFEIRSTNFFRNEPYKGAGMAC